jgi:hypothetical protein
MTKREIQTIIWQEEKIQALTERCRQLQMGYDSILAQNKKFRKKIDRLEGRGELEGVNI